MIYLFCGLATAIGLAGAYRQGRRSFFWAGGLVIGAVAAVAYATATAGSATGFKLYYALGASILPGWIGVGCLQAAFGKRLALWPGVLVILLSAVQLGLTVPASVDAEALRALDGGNGAGVLLMGGWVVPTVLFNTCGLGFAAVAAFFAWWRAFRVQDMANAALAVGLSVVVIGTLCRSDAVYKMLVAAGAGQAFLLLDALAFGLIWLGTEVTRELPRPLQELLGGGSRERLAASD